jgi:hypothetical protein
MKKMPTLEDLFGHMQLEENYNHNHAKLNDEKTLILKIWQYLCAYRFYNYNCYNQRPKRQMQQKW